MLGIKNLRKNMKGQMEMKYKKKWRENKANYTDLDNE